MALIVLLLTAALACAPAGSSGASPATLSSTVDEVRVSVTPSPNPLQSNRDTDVKISVVDDKGQAIRDARVVVTLTATAMSMSPVTAAAQAQGDGTYSALLKPTGHPGRHVITVDLEIGGRAKQVRFENVNVT